MEGWQLVIPIYFLHPIERAYFSDFQENRSKFWALKYIENQLLILYNPLLIAVSYIFLASTNGELGSIRGVFLE